MKIKRFLIPALSLGTALCVSVGVLGMSTSELAASVEARQASANVMYLSYDSSGSGTVTAEWPEGVSSEEDFSYSKSGYRNAYEKLMAEDGFI